MLENILSSIFLVLVIIGPILILVALFDNNNEEEVMTDEEMAEQYAKLNARQYIRNDGIGFCTSEEEVKQAYLAGLKAGRPKWHKVADGDLPDNTDSVLSDKGVIVYYNFTQACWVDERASVEIDDVIAWCEIPKWETADVEKHCNKPAS